MATAKKQKKGAAPPSTATMKRRSRKDSEASKANSVRWRAAQKSVLAKLKQDPILDEFDPPGRPHTFTPKMEKAFEALVTAGISIKEISKRADMPSQYMLWTFINDTDHPCHRAYTRGKQKRVASLEERIEEVAQTAAPGEIVTETYKVVDDQLVPVKEIRRFDAIEHRRLLIDTLKWTLAHTRPKKHGRQPELSADKGNTQLDSLFKSLMSGPASTDVASEEDE